MVENKLKQNKIAYRFECEKTERTISTYKKKITQTPINV